MRAPKTAVLLPASKVCDLKGDAPLLADAYQTLDRYPDLLAGQHQIRQWEYGMALHTIRGYMDAQLRHDSGWGPPRFLDVGGAGSHFWQPLMDLSSEDVWIVDPAMDPSQSFPGQTQPCRHTIEEIAANMAHGQFDVITAISVIEHVEEVRAFFRACHMLLRPGGLLFLTMDYWDVEGEDLAHFHWMRTRIYNADRVRRLAADLRELGYKSYGTADWAYHGPQVYDYSVASLAMLKREVRA